MKKSNFSLSNLRLSLNRTKLGALLVSKRKISSHDLRNALMLQKQQNKPLGEIFLEANMVSRYELSRILTQQFIMRSVAIAILSIASLGSFAGKSRAETGHRTLQPISISFNNNAQTFDDLRSYPSLLGSSEKKSRNLKPFTKWNDVFKKTERQMRAGKSGRLVSKWKNSLQKFEGQDLKTMARSVNNLMNKRPYIGDKRNWGSSDYWATPVEFLERGGDCEDFAISKYVALRSLGVPDSRLRVMIVQDTKKNIPHAVLVVYTDQGAYILDNQIKSLVNTRGAGRYRPIYSINRTAWWMHTAPGSTRVASAR